VGKEAIMERQLPSFATTLPKGRTLRLDDAKGAAISIHSGCLWITQEHDSADYVLEPDQTFHVGRDGATLVHALQHTSMLIGYPADAANAGWSPGFRVAA
jgi:hypothetical protein